MLDHDDVVTILAICEYRNFSKAGKALYIGQAALSKKVQDIEKKLGYTVFIRNRGRKSIEISDKGTELIPILYKLKQLNNNAYEIRYSSDKKLIKIASSDGPYILAIDDVIEKLYFKNNSTIFKLKNMSYKECFDALENDIVDIAFVGNNIYRKHINVFPLYGERMVFICLSGHEYSSEVDPNKLNVSNSVYSPYSTEFSSWFKTMYKNVRPLIQCDSIFQVERYIRALDLWSIVPYSVAKYISKNINILIMPLTIEPPKRLIYYAVKTNNSNAIINELLSLIKIHLSVDLNTKIY